jgi:hypothetical protein
VVCTKGHNTRLVYKVLYYYHYDNYHYVLYTYYHTIILYHSNTIIPPHTHTTTHTHTHTHTHTRLVYKGKASDPFLNVCPGLVVGEGITSGMLGVCYVYVICVLYVCYVYVYYVYVYYMYVILPFPQCMPRAGSRRRHHVR